MKITFIYVDMGLFLREEILNSQLVQIRNMQHCHLCQHTESSAVTENYISMLPIAHLPFNACFVCTAGSAVWLPGQELTQSPWDMIRKRLSQRISIHLKGI